IPKGVTSVGKSAFYGCKALNSVTIPASVKEIGESAFEWTGLTGVTIPSGVTSIGKKAFFWCFSLSSVTLSNSVTEIGDSAFYFCNDLKDVYYAGLEEDRVNISFGMGNESISGANWHYKEVE
ncbi:MAG: leucine-rich repeat domain-containing protein, partial [Clostridia bacterium]|nr:leucine-rich repeat domain-containing protein [Clostridia bacterium]